MKRRERLTEEQQRLAESVVKLARAIATNYARKYRIDEGELLSVALEAIVEHAPSYDSTRSKPSTFFTLKIRSSLMDYFRRWRKEQSRLPIEPFPDEGIPRDDRETARRESEETFTAILSYSHSLAPILRDRFESDRSFRQLAADHGVCPTRIRHLVNGVLGELRENRRAVRAYRASLTG